MVSRIFKKEIRDWWDKRVDQFILEKPIHQGQPISKWSEEILYFEVASNQYEIFWCKFREDFYNWLSRQKVQIRPEGTTLARHDCVPSNLAPLWHFDNDLTRLVDFWVHTIVEGYIVKFAAENYQSFSRVEVVFKPRLRGKLVREVSLWIKMFTMEQGLLPLPTTTVVV